MPDIASLTGRASRMIELERAGRSLSFEFFPIPPAELVHELAELPVIGDGRRGRVGIVLRRAEGEGTLTVFDRSDRRRRREYAETVALLTSPRVTVPAFVLRPESRLDRFAETFGKQDIDFPAAPSFSERFVLRGNEEGAIRHVFTPAVLAAFERYPLCVFAGTGNRLAYLEPNYPVWPGALDAFVGRARELFRLFER